MCDNYLSYAVIPHSSQFRKIRGVARGIKIKEFPELSRTPYNFLATSCRSGAPRFFDIPNRSSKSIKAAPHPIFSAKKRNADQRKRTGRRIT